LIQSAVQMDSIIHFSSGFTNTDWSYQLSQTTVNAVPLPGALPLFATGLGALGLLGWRKRRKAAV
jgi:hypothetical protein